jgi:hypothetical protein
MYVALLARRALPSLPHSRDFEPRTSKTIVTGINHPHFLTNFYYLLHLLPPLTTKYPYPQVSVVGALSAFYDKEHGVEYSDPSQRDLAGLRVVGKMTTLAAMVRSGPFPNPNTVLPKLVTVFPYIAHYMTDTFFYLSQGVQNRDRPADRVPAGRLELGRYVLHFPNPNTVCSLPVHY